MERLFLLVPVAVAALWVLRRYRQGAFRRTRRPARHAPAPGTSARSAPAASAPPAADAGTGWVFRSEDYGLVPDERLRTDQPGPDPGLDGALRAIEAGDWLPASTLLADSDPEWRWRRLTALAKVAAEEDGWLRAWRVARPDDPGAAMVYAQSLVELAWRLRGSRQADRTAPEQFDSFHRVLAQAPAALATAARLAPGDPCPYIGMMLVATGEGWSHERMRQLWAEVTARSPHHVGAHAVALQYWCAKWRGSTELMYAFAESAARAPRGSLLPALRLVARYEELLGQRSDHPGYHSAETTAAIEALLADVAAAPPGHAWLPSARHLLIWFLRAQRRFREAEGQVRLVDGYVGALPWTYNSDPVSWYSAVRQQLVLAAERLAAESPDAAADG